MSTTGSINNNRFVYTKQSASLKTPDNTTELRENSFYTRQKESAEYSDNKFRSTFGLKETDMFWDIKTHMADQMESLRVYHTTLCDQVMVKLDRFGEEKKRFVWCYRVGIVLLMIIMLCVGFIAGFIIGTQLVMPR
jgi:hypothetical protein